MAKRQGTGHGRGGGQARPLEGALLVPIGNIRAASGHPRQWFAQRPLDALAGSIRQRGMLQPLRVRPDPAAPGGYILVVGERRLRAAGRAGLTEVPVLVCTLSPDEALLDALAENVARVDLAGGELVEAYRLLRERGHSDRRIAAGIGVAHTTIGRVLRVADDALLAEAVEAGWLAMSAAWELLPLDDEAKAALIALVAARWETDSPVTFDELRAMIGALRERQEAPAGTSDAAERPSDGASDGVVPAGSLGGESGERVALDEARAAGRARALRRYVEHQLTLLAPFAGQASVAEELRAIGALLVALCPASPIGPSG
jgi:ParB family chromosome partitioning protein